MRPWLLALLVAGALPCLVEAASGPSAPARLHLFQRTEGGYTLRIPQSGWLDERDAAKAPAHGHRVVRRVVRTHRWQRAQRASSAEGRQLLRSAAGSR